MSTEDRARAVVLRSDLARAVVAGDTVEERRAQLAIVTTLLLAKPIANASAETGKARGESYLVALDDVPPWAIDVAVRHWHRGECGSGENYHWAPDTAKLRALALEEVARYRRAADDLDKLLGATTFDEAYERPEVSPAERERVIAGFAQLKADLSGRHTEPAETA